MDFGITREENDLQLMGRIDAIRQGEDIEVLESFARAYLGLFYDIDNQIAPAERIDLLANPELAESIRAGFIATLQRSDLPSVKAIVTACHAEENLSIGFVVLAGMDLLAKSDRPQILKLNEANLHAAICFHLTTSTFHHNDWYKQLLLEQPELVGDALLSMWRILLQKKSSLLPGLHEITGHEKYHKVLSYVLVPLLNDWSECRAKELSVLLGHALIKTTHSDLLQVAKNMLATAESLPVRNHVYWMATAFIIEPQTYGQELINFMGQEKMKLLPLLDYVLSILSGENASVTLSSMGYAYLVRCLAVRFTPQEDNYGNLGDITMKVLWLFYQLSRDQSEQGQEALQWLQKIRVLKLYKDVFAHMASLQKSVEPVTGFDEFVVTLREHGYLRMKIKWSDSR